MAAEHAVAQKLSMWEGYEIKAKKRVMRMNRSSFLGGSNEGVVQYNWRIAGLGERQIEFGICGLFGPMMQSRLASQAAL